MKAREAYGQPLVIFNEAQQKKIREDFFSIKNNQLFKEGSYCMTDIEFSKKILKGSNAKRALICKIENIDFSQEPPLFTVKSVFEDKTLPIKLYQSQIKPFLGDPAKIDQKFKEILDQRESKNSMLEVKILDDGVKKWVN